MKLLIGCEESGTVRDEFIKLGHDAISCDLKPARNGGKHYQGSIFDIANDGFDMAIIHPPCTYLCVTANKWLKDQPARKSGALVGAERRAAVEDAKKFFMAMWNLPIPKMCIENPKGIMSTFFRKPDQIIQPYYFGHTDAKATHLWLRGLPKLIHSKGDNLFGDNTHEVPEYHITGSGKRLPKWYAFADNTKGQAHRAEIRSKTFSGIAEAMAIQWG